MAFLKFSGFRIPWVRRLIDMIFPLSPSETAFVIGITPTNMGHYNEILLTVIEFPYVGGQP